MFVKSTRFKLVCQLLLSLIVAFNQYTWPGRVPGSEQLSIPYYHIINNHTQGEILYCALSLVVFTKTLTIKHPFCQHPSFVC